MNSLLATGIAEFVTPFFVVTVVSCVSAAVIHQTSNVGDITQSFIRAIQIAAVFIIAYNAVKKFGKISLDILLIAGCTITSKLGEYLSKSGVTDIMTKYVKDFKSKMSDEGLDMSDLTNVSYSTI